MPILPLVPAWIIIGKTVLAVVKAGAVVKCAYDINKMAKKDFKKGWR